MNMTKTKEQIEAKIAGHEAEIRAIVDRHNAMQVQFTKQAQQNQLDVNIKEGMILQLREDLKEIDDSTKAEPSPATSFPIPNRNNTHNPNKRKPAPKGV